MKHKLNILVISSIFPNNKELTKGIYIFHQTKALLEYCNIKVIAPVPYFPKLIKFSRYNIYSAIKKDECISGVDVSHPRILITPKFGRSLYGLSYALCISGLIKKLKYSFNPDIIISFWAYPDGFASSLLGRLFRIPVIIGGRGCDINTAKDFLYKRYMTSWALNKSDGVMSVSNAMKQKIIELGVPEQKIKVIPNGISDIFCSKSKKIDSQHKVPHIEDRRKTILYCGRLSEEKGLRYLISAAKILKDNNVNFYLMIVGDGPEYKQLIKLVNEFQLQEFVEFRPEVPQEKVPAIMNSADLFCLPSIREGWPNVVIEAMACGLPVVATNVGGVPEILNSQEYGIIVPKQEAEKLAEALNSAIKKSWDPYAINNAVKDRNWDSVAKEILKEIDNILK